MNDQHEQIKRKYGLVRGLGLLESTALNMTNMVGFGPFITIPLIIAALGGPQCMLGWLAGTILAICDGEDNARMIELRIPGAFWAELKSLGLIAEAAPTPSS